MYFFVDESGDPNFYSKESKLIVGNEGCSSILQLGLIKSHNPSKIRKELIILQSGILSDPFLSHIPSIEKRREKFFFHAKDDIPEVREKVFRLIKKLDFRAYIVVARKIEAIFQNKHNSNPDNFYNAMVTHLFKNQLQENTKNIIYFEKRGNKSRQKALENTIHNALQAYEDKYGTKLNVDFNVLVQTPTDEACLQIADYINWAVQRAFIKGEDRFIEFISEKIHLVWDIYDKDNRPHNFYTQTKNPFNVKKISPIKTTTELNL